jgi:hypothetical protein
MDLLSSDEEEEVYTQHQVVDVLRPLAIRVFEFGPEFDESVRLIFMEDYVADVEKDGTYLFCRGNEFLHVSPMEYAKMLPKV